MSDDDLQRLLSVRRSPTLRPMLPPVPALVAVVDTNVLARGACSAARRGRTDDLFTGLTVTGRSNVFMGAHVPGELVDHLADVAASTRIDLAAAERVLWHEIMPATPVVDLAAGDCLSPRVRPFLRDDPLLPRSMRGDPDDVETVAVAEFLAPAIILSADSVFSRLGVASTALTWIEAARSLLHAAGFEASFGDAALVVELAGRLLFAGTGATLRLVNRYPLPVLAVLAAAVYLAGRFGYLDAERFRAGVRRLRDAAQPVLEMIGSAAEGWQQARGGLFVVEPDGSPSVEQLAARYLARCGRELTPSELRDELRYAGHSLTAVGLRRAMTAHPAFIRRPGDLYSVGRRATRE